jgi:hypothetical protein
MIEQKQYTGYSASLADILRPIWESYRGECLDFPVSFAPPELRELDAHIIAEICAGEHASNPPGFRVFASLIQGVPQKPCVLRHHVDIIIIEWSTTCVCEKPKFLEILTSLFTPLLVLYPLSSGPKLHTIEIDLITFGRRRG